MPKSLKSLRLPVLLLVVSTIILLPQPISANPINPDFPITGRGDFVIIIWLVSALVEASIIIFALRHRFASVKARIKPFISVMVLNLITIPITMMLGNRLLKSDAHNTVYLAEIFPLVVEFLALLGLFAFLYKRKVIAKPPAPVNIFYLTFAANLVTFLLGLAFFHYWPTPFNPYPLPGFIM
jgi:hypothetical protein